VDLNNKNKIWFVEINSQFCTFTKKYTVMNDLIFNFREDKPQLVNSVFIIDSINQLNTEIFSERERDYIQHQLENNRQLINLNYYYHWNFIVCIKDNNNKFSRLEEFRKVGGQLAKVVAEQELDFVNIVDQLSDRHYALALVEGLALASYQFNKYRTGNNQKSGFKRINLYSQNFTSEVLEELEVLIEATYKTRDLVNEPASTLTSTKLADEAMKIGNEVGIHVQVLRKNEIQQLGMGGLLGVNQGSNEPPTFTIMEYKPKNSLNTKPIVLVGKGLVYDTGGYSLKPSDSMDDMKCDMAGAAAVMNTLRALARINYPLHIIGLIPSTDNRIGPNALSPGDIIKMHNGKTVEVLNTDAEGRLILADALSYATQFDPELTLTMATLTGSAIRAIGERASVSMGNAPKHIMEKLEQSGYKTFERIAIFPFWDDYAEELKSEIADLKNIGGKYAGAITAGKFLEKFAPNPFIHIDIAGTAFIKKNGDYAPFGATGVGVRLLVDFLKSLYPKN